jgi:chaperonin GroES
MRVTPLHDRVLVRRLDEREPIIGRIIVPDSAREKPQQGEVLAVGKGKLNDAGQRVPLEIVVGDRVLFGKYSQEITLDGEAYLILKQEELLAVFPGVAAGHTPKISAPTNARAKAPAKAPAKAKSAAAHGTKKADARKRSNGKKPSHAKPKAKTKAKAKIKKRAR